MNTILIIALATVAAVVFAVLGYLIAHHRAGSRSHRHGDERNQLRTDLKLAEEQRDQARAQADELRAERDEAQRSQREHDTERAELNTRLNAVSEERGRLKAELDAARNEYRRMSSEADRLRASLGDSGQKVRDLEGALATRDQEHAGLKATIDQLRSDLHVHQGDLEKLRTERTEVEKRQAEVTAAQEQLEQVREEQSQLQAQQVEATVAKMLKSSQEQLTATADEKLGTTAKAVTAQLQELGLHLREFDGKRTTTEARLDEQLKNLAQENARGRAQTEALVKALRKPQVRGQWGEMHLKKTVEMANLREHVDFTVQATVAGEEGALRPDMIIDLVNGRKIVVDAKVSLEAFMNAVEADDSTLYDRFMEEHAEQVRKHVDRLAAKEYFTKVAGSPDFVVMFLPNEALLQTALDKRPDLHEYALRKSVMVTTPTTLIPVLRLIALSWEEEKVRENAEHIQKSGREIYERLGTLSGHLSTLGKNLDRAVECYNKTIGSLESNLLPAARRIRDLGVSSGKDLPALSPTDSMTRSIKAPELMESTIPEGVAAQSTEGGKEGPGPEPVG